MALARTLKIGVRGKDIEALQIFLGINADGVFGRQTDDAVKAFQFNNGITVDGIVGDDTYRALQAAGYKIPVTSIEEVKQAMSKSIGQDYENLEFLGIPLLYWGLGVIALIGAGRYYKKF